jgi:hypothetical protein
LRSYYAYGLEIDSELALPELASQSSPVSAVVSIRVGSVERRGSNVPERDHYASPEEIVLSYEGVARLRIAGGREILVDPEPDADASVLRLCLLGPAMGVLLHQRGMLVLHASAVRVAGGASIFLGGKGWGKSTLAAYLHTRGCDLVADDIVPIELADDGTARVYPGSPHCKLWPHAAGFLGFDLDALPRLQPDLEKRDARAIGPFSLEPLPLRRVYVIAYGDRVEVEPVEPREALLELVRHSYLLRFLLASGTHGPHFRQCSALVHSVGLHRLTRPADIERLPLVGELLEDH